MAQIETDTHNLTLDLNTHKVETLKEVASLLEANKKPTVQPEKPFTEWFNQKKDDVITAITSSMIIVGSAVSIPLLAPFEFYSRIRRLSPEKASIASLIFAPPLITIGTSLAQGDTINNAALKGIASLAAEGLLIVAFETKIKH